MSVPHHFPEERTDEDYPLTLMTGRILMHYQTGVQTRTAPELNKTSEPYVEIHPDRAADLGLADKGLARIVSRRGEIVLPVKFSAGIREDTVFVPFHWEGNMNINQLTLPELDPESRMPEFKACAVRVTTLEMGSMENQLEKREVLV